MQDTYCNQVGASQHFECKLGWCQQYDGKARQQAFHSRSCTWNWRLRNALSELEPGCQLKILINIWHWLILSKITNHSSHHTANSLSQLKEMSHALGVHQFVLKIHHVSDSNHNNFFLTYRHFLLCSDNWNVSTLDGDRGKPTLIDCLECIFYTKIKDINFETLRS